MTDPKASTIDRQTMNPPQVSVVVPVYRSERTIAALAERIEKTMVEAGLPYELIFVNDGSPDASWPLIQELVSKNENFTGINFMRNFGQHNALLAGIRHARGAVIVTIDDDLQHLPEEIPRLLAALEPGIDVVYGTPRSLQHSVSRNLFSWVIKLVVQKAMGAETARKVNAFRAFRTQVRDGFQKYESPLVNIDVLLTWATTRFKAIEVEHHPRTIGKSNYTLSRLASHAVTMITGFSTLPLRLASVIGISFTMLGVLVLLYVLVVFMTVGRAVPGFAFLASIIAIFSGAQLFALGIIGEYLARIHMRSMDRPAYTIADVVESGRENRE